MYASFSFAIRGVLTASVAPSMKAKNTGHDRTYFACTQAGTMDENSVIGRARPAFYSMFARRPEGEEYCHCDSVSACTVDGSRLLRTLQATAFCGTKHGNTVLN